MVLKILDDKVRDNMNAWRFSLELVLVASGLCDLAILTPFDVDSYY